MTSTHLIALTALFLAGCAEPRMVNVARVVTPETMSVGLTAPNLFNGPIVANKGSNDSRRDSVGVIGATISFTWRLKPIRIERAEVQPVRIVRAATTPAASPTPKP